MWLRLTQQVYTELCALKLALDDQSMHTQLLEGTAEAWLQVWYVLGGLPNAPHFAARVKCGAESRAPGKNVALLRVSMTDGERVLLSPTKKSNEVLALKRTAAANARHDASTTLIWRV